MTLGALLPLRDADISQVEGEGDCKREFMWKICGGKRDEMKRLQLQNSLLWKLMSHAAGSFGFTSQIRVAFPQRNPDPDCVLGGRGWSCCWPADSFCRLQQLLTDVSSGFSCCFHSSWSSSRLCRNWPSGNLVRINKKKVTEFWKETKTEISFPFISFFSNSFS